MSLLNNRFAAVVAGSVLVVGLGASGAVAGTLITSGQIQDGTIQGKDLRPGLKERAVTDSGSEVIVGAGYAGLGGHDYWAANSYGESLETCPEGQYAIGGGYSTWGGFNGTHDGYDLGGTNLDIQVTVSAPYFKGAYVPVDEAGNFRADQWVVRGFNHGTEDQIVRAWVNCATVAD